MKVTDFIRYIAALSLLSIPIFYNLGELPIRAWDESRLAMNAWEMYSNKNFLVTYFNGEPDMWNTKPPLMIWLQATCIWLFGLSEFSIRLPSAVAALLTCLTIIVIFHKYLGKFWLGMMAAVILVTIDRYNGHHVIRTGDYDSLLILLLTLSAYVLFLYSEKENSKFILFSLLFFGLAIATKGIAGFLIIPGLMFYLVLKRQLLAVVKQPYFWLGSILVLLIVLVFYGGREYYNPGYLKAVFQNEIGGRYLEVNEGHVGGPFFYLGILFEEYWMYFLPVVFFTFRSKEKNKFYRISQFSLITAFSFLFFVSIAKTKLYWYVAPVYPFIAIALAIGFYNCYCFIKQRSSVEAKKLVTYISIMIALISAFPLARTVFKIAAPKVFDYEEWLYEMSYFLRDSQVAGKDLSGYYFLRDQYQPHIDFYVLQLQQDGVELSIGSFEALEKEDLVLYWEDPVEENLKKNFEYEKISSLNSSGQVREIRVLFPKETSGLE